MTSKFASLEKVLFRATHGNFLIKYEELSTLIKDPVTGKLEQKSVFIVFSQGERLSAKILKICESFQVNIYQMPGKIIFLILLYYILFPLVFVLLDLFIYFCLLL